MFNDPHTLALQVCGKTRSAPLDPEKKKTKKNKKPFRKSRVYVSINHHPKIP
jgi:hypothetical protein